DVLVDAHVHSAQLLDDLVEATEVDQRRAVEPDAQQLRQRPRQQLHTARALPAILERGVDLVEAPAEPAIRRWWDVHPQVTWHRVEERPVHGEGYVHDNDRVRRRTHRRILGPRVRADQQEVERAGEPGEVGALGTLARVRGQQVAAVDGIAVARDQD